MNFSDPF